MPQNNELMLKMNFIEEASGLVVKCQRGRSQSRGPTKDPIASSSDAYYYCRKPSTLRKNVSITRRC